MSYLISVRTPTIEHFYRFRVSPLSASNFRNMYHALFKFPKYRKTKFHLLTYLFHFFSLTLFYTIEHLQLGKKIIIHRLWIVILILAEFMFLLVLLQTFRILLPFCIFEMSANIFPSKVFQSPLMRHAYLWLLKVFWTLGIDRARIVFPHFILK